MKQWRQGLNANQQLQSAPVPVATLESTTLRVINDASKVFGDTIAQETLADWASAVAELWGDSVKVTNFVPLLAMRKISSQVATLTNKERETTG